MNSRSNASWSCCPGIKEPAEASRFQGASFCNYFFPGLQTQESTGLTIFFGARLDRSGSFAAPCRVPSCADVGLAPSQT